MHLQNKYYKNKIIIHILFVLYIMLCSVVYIGSLILKYFTVCL